MQYVNGDVYDGEWESDKRSGHGTLTYGMSLQPLARAPTPPMFFARAKGAQRACAYTHACAAAANGNVYNGSFLHDKKEGAGRFFFLAKCTVFSGEWADDVARCGSYAAGTLDDAAAPQGADSKPLPEVRAARKSAQRAYLRRQTHRSVRKRTVKTPSLLCSSPSGSRMPSWRDASRKSAPSARLCAAQPVRRKLTGFVRALLAALKHARETKRCVRQEEEERSEDVRAVFDELDDGACLRPVSHNHVLVCTAWLARTSRHGLYLNRAASRAA